MCRVSGEKTPTMPRELFASRPSARRGPGLEIQGPQCAFEMSMFMCPAVHMSTRNLLRSSSTHEPSDPPFRVVMLVHINPKRRARRREGNIEKICQTRYKFRPSARRGSFASATKSPNPSHHTTTSRAIESDAMYRERKRQARQRTKGVFAEGEA